MNSGHCDCTRFLHELSGRVIEYPDHICPQIANRSCVLWRHEMLRDVTNNEIKWIRLPDGRYADASGFQWPIPILNDAKGIVIVIRHWIEDSPQPELAEKLETLSSWQEIVHKAQRQFHSPLTRSHPLMILNSKKARILPTDQDYSYIVIRDWLRSAGLPTTPSTINHVLWLAEGKPKDVQPAYPARGVLITSLAVTPLHWNESKEKFDWDIETEIGEVIHDIAVLSQWKPEDFGERAEKMVNRITQLLDAISFRQPVTQLPKGRRSKDDQLNEDIKQYLQGTRTSEQRDAIIARYVQNCKKQYQPSDGNYAQYLQLCRKRVKQRLQYAEKKDAENTHP